MGGGVEWAAAAKIAARELAKLAGRPMSAHGWSLAGEVSLGAEVTEEEARLFRRVKAGFRWGEVEADSVARLVAPVGAVEVLSPFRRMAYDGASVPRLVTLAGQAAGMRLAADSYRLPAWFHDSWYRAGEIWVRLADGAAAPVRVEIARHEADALYLASLRAAGATVAEGAAYFEGVRLWGGGAWRGWRESGEEAVERWVWAVR